jgi:Tol biopolymer transport system component
MSVFIRLILIYTLGFFVVVNAALWWPFNGSASAVTYTFQGSLYAVDLGRDFTYRLVRRPSFGAIVGYEWSPDGRRLAYAVYEPRAIDTRLYVRFEDGLHESIMYIGQGSYHWLPNSREIVLLYPLTVGVRDVIDGSWRSVPIQDMNDIYHTNFLSLSDVEIGVIGTIRRQDEPDAYRLNLMTGEASTLETPLCPQSFLQSWAWSPDRSQVIASCWGDMRLFVADDVQVVDDNAHFLGDAPGTQTHADWSADGKQVMFTYTPSLSEGEQTYAIDPVSRELTPVLQQQSAFNIRWLPLPPRR